MSIGLNYAPSIPEIARSKSGEELFFELMTQEQIGSPDTANTGSSPQEYTDKFYHALLKKADSDPTVEVERRYTMDPEQETEIIKRYDTADTLLGEYTTLDEAILLIAKNRVSVRFVGRGTNTFVSIPQVQNINKAVSPFPRSPDPKSPGPMDAVPESPEKQITSDKDQAELFTYSMEITYNNDGTATITLTAGCPEESPSFEYFESTLQFKPYKVFTHGKYEFRTNDPVKKGRRYSISTRNPTIIASDTNRIWGTEFNYDINPEHSLRSFIQHFTENDYFPHPDMVMFTTKSGIPQPAYRSPPSEQ